MISRRNMLVGLASTALAMTDTLVSPYPFSHPY